ncbi:MAG: hypothetical protein IKF11_04610 [Methanobrevibacter sp.]|nr:hypothetical protein [Methanobrevibacter sp.]
MVNDLTPSNFKRLTLADFRTELDTPKSLLKNEIGNLELKYAIVEQDLLKKTFNSVVRTISESEPDAPLDIVKAFVSVYIEFIISKEYNIRTLSYELVCTPVWKDVDMIDMGSDEFKIISEYAWSGY